MVVGFLECGVCDFTGYVWFGFWLFEYLVVFWAVGVVADFSYGVV